MPKSRRVFLILSLVLFLSDTLFVALNYVSDRRALEQSIHEQARERRSAFELTLRATLDSMQQMATFIANDPQVQRLLLAGMRAVEAEGGGTGGPRAAVVRQQLLELMGPSWRQMAQEFDVRQLHFHLGPGSLSFLRVHQPDRFGDRMDDVRFLIVDSYARQQALTGFETGRVYSGLRGVVPVFATDPGSGERVHAGTLEVGTSFTSLFELLDQQLDVGIAVLLRADHVEEAMWESFVASHFDFSHNACHCMVEETSRPVQGVLSAVLEQDAHLTDFHSHLVQVGNEHLGVVHLPLHDYHSQTGAADEPAGAIMMWGNAEREVAAFERSLRINIAYGAFGFLVIELLLFYAIRFVTRRLETEVQERTGQVRDLNARLQTLARTDPLTGLFNRRYFMERLEAEGAAARRHGHPLSLMILDLDHFKRINDRHGHLVGDTVLRAVAETVGHTIRADDVLARYGGEEFCILAPNTALAEASALAERVRAAVAGMQVSTAQGEPIPVTVSTGVSRLSAEAGVDVLLERADTALYRAKHNGRNRVEGTHNDTQTCTRAAGVPRHE